MLLVEVVLHPLHAEQKLVRQIFNSVLSRALNLRVQGDPGMRLSFVLRWLSRPSLPGKVIDQAAPCLHASLPPRWMGQAPPQPLAMGLGLRVRCPPRVPKGQAHWCCGLCVRRIRGCKPSSHLAWQGWHWSLCYGDTLLFSKHSSFLKGNLSRIIMCKTDKSLILLIQMHLICSRGCYILILVAENNYSKVR